MVALSHYYITSLQYYVQSSMTRIPTNFDATRNDVKTAETRLMVWLHLVARTKSIPKDYVCSDNCEQHALYGRMFNAHPLEKSPLEVNGPSDPPNPSILESLEEELKNEYLDSSDSEDSVDDSSDEDDEDTLSHTEDKAPVPIIKITMPKPEDDINLEDVD